MKFAKFASSPRGMVVLLGILVVLVFAGSFLLGRALNQHSQTASAPDIPEGAAQVNPPITLTDFALTGTDGEPITLSDLRGKLSMLFFGYTNCPDVCPTTMAEYAEVKRLLGDDADNVNLVFVSVDGARDTPERVADWLSIFDSSIVGMTGTPEELAPLGQRFGLIYERVQMVDGTLVPLPTEDHNEHAEGTEAENYFVNHTSPSFIIDANGVLRYLYFYGTEAATMAAGLREILEG